MQAKAGSSAAKGAKQATGSSVNRGWMPSSYYSSSTFTSHNPFVSHGTRAKAFALPSQMQFHDALFYDATDSVADALEQDDLPFIETTPRTRVAAIGARSALICVAILTATLYYVAFLLGRQHVPVLLVLSLAIATVATGLLALSCTGILGIQRLAALGATPHAQHRFHAPSPAVPPAVGAPARVVPTGASASASAAAATTSVGSAAHRSVPSMPAYFDAAALGIMTSDDDGPALHTFHALGGADDAPKHSMGAQSGEGGSDSETFHLSLAPTDPDSLDAPAALSAAAPGSAATVAAVSTPLAATLPSASDATAEAGEYSGALAAFFDGGGATDDDALLAALSPAPVNVHVHPRSSAASASLSASSAAPADGVAGVGAGAAAAAGGDVMSATEDSDAGLTRVRARSRSGSSGRHGLLLSSVNAQTPAKGRNGRSGRNATARPGAGGGHSAAATALSLITAFLTYATPVAIVLLTVSGLLAAFPAHASAYVHVRWHEALTQSSAVTPIAYTPSVAAAAWSAPNAAGVASNGTSLAPLPSRNRMGVAPSLRRSHRLVSLALRVVATVTLLSGLLVAAAAGLVYAWLLPVALPPVPIFASATPVAGVTAAVLISAGAVMDISAGDCAHTTAVAAALARSAAAAASSASAAASSAAASLLELTSSAAVNAVVSVNSGAHTSSAVSAATAAAAAASTHASVARAHAHAALSFFWGSSERVCAHSRAPVFMSALLLLTGVSLLALVMLNIFTLKKVFHPSRPSPVAAAAAATTAPAGSSAGTVTAPAPAPAHEAAGGTFRLKARTQLSWDMVSAQTRRVLAAIVLLAFPVMIVSLLRSEVGLHQHLLSSPAVAHDISVKVMGAHLLQTAATGSQPPAIAAGQNRAKAGKSSAAATAAVATMGPFESIAEAREEWFEHVAAVRTAHSASSTAQGSAKASTDVGGVTGMVDALGMTSGVDTGAEEDASAAAAATAAATLASEDPVRIDLARKVSHEFDKISLVAYVHVTALSVLVILSFVIVFSYIGLGVKAERLVSVSTGEYSVR